MVLLVEDRRGIEVGSETQSPRRDEIQRECSDTRGPPSRHKLSRDWRSWFMSHTVSHPRCCLRAIYLLVVIVGFFFWSTFRVLTSDTLSSLHPSHLYSSYRSVTVLTFPYTTRYGRETGLPVPTGTFYLFSFTM